MIPRHRHWTSKVIAVSLCAALASPALWAQQQQRDIAPEKPGGTILIRPYRTPYVPPVRLGNSTRLQQLIRAGKLYLTAQDAVALALENNIDVELARYTPIMDVWNEERAEAGGPLPGIPSGSSQSTTVASGEGVAGSEAAAGVSSSGSNSTSGNAVNASITQIGPVTPTLDPVVQSTQAFSHISSLSPNVVLAGVYNLVEGKRNYSDSISQGLITGGTVTLGYSDSYLNENALSDLLNPENGTTLSFTFRHNLLQGFGVAVNARNITIAKANLRLDDVNFKGEIINEVASVLNLYYGLVADYEDLKAKQSAVDVAQQFYENNKKEVQLGAMAPLDVTTAEAQLASSQQDLVVSQTTLDQQEVSLKNVLSRNGLADPLIREVQIIPLDRIDVPAQDNLPPLKDLIATALRSRPDLAANKINFSNSQISAMGTANGVLPTLVTLGGASTQGLNGAPRITVLRGAQGLAATSPIPPGFEVCP